MSYGLAQARYASDAAQTVSADRLVTMLYDRLVLDLTTAEDAMHRQDVRVVGERLGHAQEILLELYGSLYLEVWPEGEPLSRLYLWLVQELMQARVRSDPERVVACRHLLEPLRDAWRRAATGQPVPLEVGEDAGTDPVGSALAAVARAGAL